MGFMKTFSYKYTMYFGHIHHPPPHFSLLFILIQPPDSLISTFTSSRQVWLCVSIKC